MSATVALNTGSTRRNVLSRIRSLPLFQQHAICITAVAVVALGCFPAEGLIGYRVTALVLLMAVSILAMLFRIGPVMVAAALSALAWNFFFIPPTFTFHIGSTEDLLLFLMYFVVASVNAVLSLKIRQVERKARDKEQKERTIELYNTLLNSLSHELRTPISTIVGAVDALQDRETRLTGEQRTDLLSAIDEAGMRLDRQVGNLLNMGRLESGMLEPKADWCDIHELIGGVVSKLGSVSDHAIILKADPSLPLFKLDGGLLEQVVHNMVHNAVQYTPAGSEVVIGASHADGSCVITIADNGPGFPEQERVRAFNKFHRLPNTRSGGTGLGLSIVKGFVGAQGGSVELGANQPHGALFTVRIPAETSFLSNLKHE